MNRLMFLWGCVLLLGCNFNQKAPIEEDLLRERLQEINWDEVTRYPCVEDCDTLQDKESQRQSFVGFMTRMLKDRLEGDTLRILFPQIDTVWIRARVGSDGSVVFAPKIGEYFSDNKRIDSIIRKRLGDFPKLEPAQKEGVPVATELVLPVILKIE